MERVNASDYALGGSIWTSNVALAFEIAKRFDSGLVWINEALFSTPLFAYSGRKQSGIGTQGGVEGLQEYMDRQFLTIRKPRQ